MKISKIKWNKPYTRESWLKQRKELQGIGNLDVVRYGSSDVSTLLGINKWSSPKKLFYNHLGKYLTDIPSYKLEMGLMFEDANKKSFESFTADRTDFDYRFVNNIKINKLIKPKYFLTNSLYPHSFSSLDFILPKGSTCPFTGEITTKDRPVETKFVNYNSYSSFNGEAPLYYVSQVMHQMMVMNSDCGYLSIIAGGDFYDCFLIERDNNLIERIDNVLGESQLSTLKAKQVEALMFEEEAKPLSEVDSEYLGNLSLMLTELEPELIGHKADLDFLEDEMYPTTNSLEMVGDDNAQFLIDKYLKTNKLINTLEDTKRKVRCQITEIMQEFEILKTERSKVISRRGVEGKKPYFSCK